MAAAGRADVAGAARAPSRHDATTTRCAALAMGAFTAFLDLALGIARPALGLVADQAGLGSVFLAGTLVVLGATLVAARLLRAPARA